MLSTTANAPLSETSQMKLAFCLNKLRETSVELAEYLVFLFYETPANPWFEDKDIPECIW